MPGTGTSTAAGHLARSYSVSHEVIEYILGDGPKPVEALKANELTTGTSGTGEVRQADTPAAQGDDVLDAELIQETPVE